MPRKPDSAPASPRVRLEVAFLDADQAAPAPAPPATDDARACLTVLVVAAEADFRRYVRECLRDRAEVRLLEAATVADAVALSAGYSPSMLIVDDPERSSLIALSSVRAIVIVDEVPRGAPASDTRHRLLARPFTAEALTSALDGLLR